jgi:transposase
MRCWTRGQVAHVLYLPPYLPDLNTIEMAFSKPNALLRRAAERTIPNFLSHVNHAR